MTQTAGTALIADDEVLTEALVRALNAVRMYDEQFRDASMHLSSRVVTVRMCTDRQGNPLLAVRTRRIEPAMHHVVGTQIRALWPGIAYLADVRW